MANWSGCIQLLLLLKYYYYNLGAIFLSFKSRVELQWLDSDP